MRKRLDVYHAQTEPLVAYYADGRPPATPRAPKYRKVSGIGSVEAIGDAVRAALAA